MQFRRRKYRTYQGKRILNRFINFYKIHFSLSITIVTILLLISTILFFSLRSKIYHPSYQINQVLFTSGSVTTYNNPELYASIINIYSGTYYTSLQWFRPKIYSNEIIQDTYPFIQDIQEIEFANNTLLVDIKFKSPIVRLRYHDGDYVLYSDMFIRLSTGDRIGEGLPIILLPIYLSGTSESLSGILYSISPYKLLSDHLLLQTAPIQGSLTYVPGGEKYILWNEQQRVYFNTRKDIAAQLLKLLLLHQHYPGFDSLQQIDVGSINDPIVR